MDGGEAGHRLRQCPHRQDDGLVERERSNRSVARPLALRVRVHPPELHGHVGIAIERVVVGKVGEVDRRIDRLVGGVDGHQRAGEEAPGFDGSGLEQGPSVVLHPRVGDGHESDLGHVPVAARDVRERKGGVGGDQDDQRKHRE